MTRPRIALGLLALPGGLSLTGALTRGSLRLLSGSTSPGADPAAAITGLTAGLAALITAWLTLCLGLALAAVLPGAAGETARRLRDRITPVLVQRWAAVVLGASVTATVAPGTAVAAERSVTDPSPTAVPETDSPDRAWAPSPGWATTPHRPAPTGPTTLPAPGWTAGPSTRPQTTPSPGWVPRRPPPRPTGDPHLVTGRQRSTATHTTGASPVVVRRGDSLWSIAAARLGAEATDAEIARAWPRWHATNRALLGDDPHALRPGMQLTPPTDS